MPGDLMPGHQFWAPVIDDIDPSVTLGYSNVVLMVGINNIKKPDVKCANDVADCYANFRTKVEQIRQLNPKCNILICRLLPTKAPHLNSKVITFNRLIYNDLLRVCSSVQVVDGFIVFADNNELLAGHLSKAVDKHGNPDLLHLNRSGVRILAGLIKRCIFSRLHGGRDRRRQTSRVDGRLYSSVTRGMPAPRLPGEDGCQV